MRGYQLTELGPSAAKVRADLLRWEPTRWPRPSSLFAAAGINQHKRQPVVTFFARYVVKCPRRLLKFDVLVSVPQTSNNPPLDLASVCSLASPKCSTPTALR